LNNGIEMSTKTRCRPNEIEGS